MEVADRTEQAVQGSIRHLSSVKRNLENFVKVGAKPRLALLRVKTRLANLQMELADVQAERITVAGNLRRLLDLNPSGPPLQLTDNLGSSSLLRGPDHALPTTFQQALDRRPDYLALQQQRIAQEARLRAARGARLPRVDLSARAWEAHGNNTGGPVSTWEPDSQIMLSVSVPIFTGGTLNATVSRQHALLDQIDNKLEGLKQKIRLQVTQTYAELRAAKTKINAAKSGVLSADEAFRVERQKTALGVGTTTDLLDAQAADLVAQTSYLQALAGYQIAATKVQWVTGVLSISHPDSARASY